MWKTWVRYLGQEDPLEKEMATHSSILVWKTPRMEEPGRLHGVTKSRHDWMTNTQINRLNVIEIKVIKGQKCASPRIYREVVKNKKKAQKLTVSAALSSCFIITIIINVTKSLVEVSPLHSLHLLFPSPLLPCWKKHHQNKQTNKKKQPRDFFYWRFHYWLSNDNI